MRRQHRQGSTDVTQGYADPLRRADERHLAQRVPSVAPLVAAGASARNQPNAFVEVQRRDRNP